MIDWVTPRDAIVAALPDVSAPMQRIGARLLDTLNELGPKYDTLFAPGYVTLQTEGSAHLEWRTVTMPQSIADMHALATVVDGAPTPPTGTDLKGAWRQAFARLRAIATNRSFSAHPLIDAIRSVTDTKDGADLVMPREPAEFYVSGYYAGSILLRGGERVTKGALEARLISAIAAASAWLGVVT
jgi:hypothetical protein